MQDCLTGKKKYLIEEKNYTIGIYSQQLCYQHGYVDLQRMITMQIMLQKMD